MSHSLFPSWYNRDTNLTKDLDEMPWETRHMVPSAFKNHLTLCYSSV